MITQISTKDGSVNNYGGKEQITLIKSQGENLCNFFKICVISLSCIFILSSCSTTPVRTTPATGTYTPPGKFIDTPSLGPGTIYRQQIVHEVAPMETLWRISKMYDVDMKDIMRYNNLTDADELKMGQKLVIPNAAPLKAVVSLYPSKKWRYIIIHHSATDYGDALTFYKMHLKRGFWRGLGYHFVINNGTNGKKDGQIEMSPRWIKQQDGAHCKAGGMNHKGIGICLVGNFSEDYGISEKQMDSLVYLVNTLRSYYNIPLTNIMGHGQVPGARTECPGSHCPWASFMAKLKNSYKMASAQR